MGHGDLQPRSAQSVVVTLGLGLLVCVFGLHCQSPAATPVSTETPVVLAAAAATPTPVPIAAQPAEQSSALRFLQPLALVVAISAGVVAVFRVRRSLAGLRRDVASIKSDVARLTTALAQLPAARDPAEARPYEVAGLPKDPVAHDPIRRSEAPRKMLRNSGDDAASLALLSKVYAELHGTEKFIALEPVLQRLVATGTAGTPDEAARLIDRLARSYPSTVRLSAIRGQDGNFIAIRDAATAGDS